MDCAGRAKRRRRLGRADEGRPQSSAPLGMEIRRPKHLHADFVTGVMVATRSPVFYSKVKSRNFVADRRQLIQL